MGRGTIVSGGTDGLYTVDLDYGSTRADQLIDYLQTAITDIDVAIAAAESVAESASLSLSSVLSALNGAIVTYTGDESDENKEALQEATEAAAEAEVAKEKATVKVSGLKYQKMALESRLSAIQAIDVTERADVWCVDLTEDASGSVATIEVNGEGGQGILIAPEGRFPDAGDGYMTARAVQSAEQVFYNAAILPGWQKYAPTFRTGTISNIDYDNDTCTVTLDSAVSTAQSLGINQATLLEGVEVEYMNCNAKAFDNGDKVVVQFVGQSWSSPKVIGFVSNPKPCGPAYIAFRVDNDPAATYNSGYGDIVTWGEPNDDEITSYPLQSMVQYTSTAGPAAGGGSNAHRQYYEVPRIRFDTAWVKQKASDTYFDGDVRYTYREQTSGESVNCGLKRENLDCFNSNFHIGVYTSLVRQDYEPVGGVYSGTTTTVYYSLGEFQLHPVPGYDYVSADYSEATGWFSNYLTFPTTIYIRDLSSDSEKYIRYTLDSFGPPAYLLNGNDYHTLYPNPGNTGTAFSDRTFEIPMAIYKRANGG